MSTKDITRFLHQPRKHYVAARLQQGRALLDSDFNEGARLAEDDRRQSLLGMLGPAASSDNGFSIGRVLPRSSPRIVQVQPLRAGDAVPVQPVRLGGTFVNVHAVSIRSGSIYVGGMRFDLGQPEHIAFQRDFLQMLPSDLPTLERSPSPSPYSPRSPRSPQFPTFRYFYYLNAWEQAVTSVEDEEFLERGLGGPDTTVRVRRMRRVEFFSVSRGIDNCLEAWEETIARLQSANNAVLDRASGELVSRARLSLGFELAPVSECEPCTPDPPAQYLGSENQALRIMLTGPRTFVWGFDNAAPLYRVKVTGLSNDNPNLIRVTMLTPPRDEEHQPRAQRVIEILPFAALLEGGEGERPNDPHYQKVAAEVGVFTRVTEYDDPTHFSFKIDTSRSERVNALKALVHEWDGNHPAAAQLNIKDPKDDGRFFYMRFWHLAENTDQIELGAPNSLKTGQPLGNTGIIPVLHQAGRRGDFWVATLRPDTPERIVPFDLLTRPGGVPPHGPRHFYAPLALVDGSNLRVFSIEDCRTRIRRMTDRGCATYTVGDGANSVGDYSSINDAIDALPFEGGLVSVGPGTFREEIRVFGRRGVVVQGCGEASVIQSPATTTASLIEISESEGVAFSGFRINVGEQTGIDVSASGDVNLNGLMMVAGTIDGDQFSEEPGAGDEPVIRATQTELFALNEIVMASQRRPAISVSESRGVAITKLSCQGADASSAVPAAPMVLLDGTERARIRDSELRAFGQVGIHLTSTTREVELSALSLFAGFHGVGEGDFQARSSVDIDGSERVRLEHSRIAQDDAVTEHAAVVVQGRHIVIDDNAIEGGIDESGTSTLSAWGGIQIRGGSHDVEVRDNRIIAGLGHGITLGSVLWLPNPSDDPRREGAGFRQIDFLGEQTEPVVTGLLQTFQEDFVTYTPDLEGDLTEIRLIGNHVRNLASNGISVITLVGCGDQLVGIRRSVIEKNTISGNLARPMPNMQARTDLFEQLANPPTDDFTLPMLPFGGIVLGEVADGIDIRDNLVVGNGTSEVVAQNGIFILAGDGIVISGNRVADNGGRAHPDSPEADDQPPREGIRAGIAVLLAGVTPVVNPLLPDLEAFLGETSPVLESAGVALQIMNNNVGQPEGRALHAVAAGPVMIDGNFFSSRGNHGTDEAGELGALGEVIFLMNLGRPWESYEAADLSLVAETDEFSEYDTPSRTRNYLTGIVGSESPHSPPRFIGLGGQVTFSNNQVAFDWNLVRLPGSSGDPQFPISFFPVTLLALDHLSVASNHFTLRLTFPPGSTAADWHWDPNVPTGESPLRPEPVAGHVLAQGATVAVARNRFSEQVGSVTLSLFSGAELMNLTAYNQSTHIVGAHKWAPTEDDAPYLVNEQNQVLFFNTTIGDPAPFADIFRGLLDILWLPVP